MRLSAENAENGFSELINVEDPLASWLLRTFHRFERREIIGVALIVSGIPFVVSGIIAFLGGFALEFLTTVSVYIWTAGLFGGTLMLGWWAKRYPELWMKLRSSFDVSDSEYWAVVRPRIAKMYDLRRALLWFLIVGMLAIINWVVAIGLTVRMINFTYTSVSLLGLMIGFHVVFTHLRLVSDIMELRLRDIQTAAAELKPLARFNIVVSVGWFINFALGIMVLRTGLSSEDFSSVLSFVEKNPLGTVLLLSAFLFGFMLFIIPQYSIHARLRSEKQTLLDEIDTEFDRLYEDVSSTDGATNSFDQVSMQSDLLDARRRSAKEIQTWAYDLPGIVSLISASVVPILSLFV